MRIGTLIEYRGCQGTFEYSTEDNVYYGKLLNIKDLVNYEGNSGTELFDNYKDAIDDYISFCDKLKTDIG